MAKFKPGESGNKNGRPPGSKNLITRDLREALKILISDELTKLPDLLGKLEPKDRVDLTIKLLSFVLPKLEKVDPDYGEPKPTMDEMLAEM